MDEPKIARPELLYDHLAAKLSDSERGTLDAIVGKLQAALSALRVENARLKEALTWISTRCSNTGGTTLAMTVSELADAGYEMSCHARAALASTEDTP